MRAGGGSLRFENGVQAMAAAMHTSALTAERPMFGDSIEAP